MRDTTNNTPTILIMAGGTGGHIFPALAIASVLKNHAVNIQWLGSSQGMENTIVPKHGIKLHTITAVGLRGKRAINLLKAPFLLAYATLQTVSIIIKTRPNMVLGMGGFTAGIGGMVAWLFNIPLVIHEQNAIAGTTNKLLNRLSKKTFQAFDNALPQAITVGNPIAFTPVEKQHNNKEQSGKLNLLIIGGSLGSKPINDVVTKLTMNINIWHQTGKQHFDAVKTQHQNQTAKVTPFIDDMSAAYGWADVVLCRAGAMTVSELMLSATASILVPLPHAIDNHQFHNAKVLSDNNAGILIQQSEFNIQRLEQTLQQLTQDKLTQMGLNAQQLAKPNATQDVVNYLVQPE